MRILKTLAIVLTMATLLLSFGCSKKAPTAELQALKDKICACEDAECAGAIVDALKSIGSSYTGFEDEKKGAELIQAATMCAVQKDPNVMSKLAEMAE